MRHEDPFDADALGVDPATIRQPRPKKWQRLYVRVPWAWVEQLQAAKRISTYRLAHLLLYEHWRQGGRELVLSNVLAREIGLPRQSKLRAIEELESLGLIVVKRKSGRAPKVVLLRVTGSG